MSEYILPSEYFEPPEVSGDGKPRQLTPKGQKFVDERMQAWKESAEFKESSRISSVAYDLEGILYRLDNLDAIDDAWSFWNTPEGDRPAKKPNAKERWAAARNNYSELLTDMHKTQEAAQDFDDSKDIRVCLEALNQEIFLEPHDELLWLGDEAHKFSEAIRMMKDVFGLARECLRPTLMLLAARTKLTAHEIRAKQSDKFFPDWMRGRAEKNESGKAIPATDDPAVLQLVTEIKRLIEENPEAGRKGVLLRKKLRRRNSDFWKAFKIARQSLNGDAGGSGNNADCSGNKKERS
jgi:hypothetical protein